MSLVCRCIEDFANSVTYSYPGSCLIIYISDEYAYMTGTERTDHINTKYTCSYHGTYLLFYMCYTKSVSFIGFHSNFCIYSDNLDIGLIPITDESYYILNSQNEVKFYV